jgi:hypothetical protein
VNHCSLARPPDICISWKQSQEPPPDRSNSQEKPQTAVGLFAASLIFDKFPLNSLLYDSEFRGNLSNYFADFSYCSKKGTQFSEKPKNLKNLADPPYNIRAPPFLTFAYHK